jgi:hypothetical protein
MAFKIDWAKARKDWELGMSVGQVAKKYSVTASAVLNHKKNDGWTRDIPSDVPPEQVVQGFAGQQTVRIDEIPGLEARTRIAELERQLAEAERTNREQAVELQKHKPTLEWHVYQTPAEVREYLGEEKLRDIAGLELAEQNRMRVKRGLPPFSYESDPAMYEREIGKILEELLTRRTKYIDAGQRLRVVKMAARSPEGGWSIVQVPVEVQINNEAAQSGAAIWKQRDKGRKLVMPYLCQRINCWAEALVGPDGKFVYAGYCSSECFGTDPYLNKTPVPGVAMSKAVGM